MKKCATIIFYSALFLLFSCADSKKERIITNAGTQQEQADNKETKSYTIKVHEEYTFANIKESILTRTCSFHGTSYLAMTA